MCLTLHKVGRENEKRLERLLPKSYNCGHSTVQMLLVQEYVITKIFCYVPKSHELTPASLNQKQSHIKFSKFQNVLVLVTLNYIWRGFLWICLKDKNDHFSHFLMCIEKLPYGVTLLYKMVCSFLICIHMRTKGIVLLT